MNRLGNSMQGTRANIWTVCDMCPITHEFSAEPVCHARLHRTRSPNIYRLWWGSTTNSSGAPSHTYKCCRPFVIWCVSPTVATRVTCAFLGSHTFPKKITTGIVFYIGHGLLRVLVCDKLISQTVSESLRTRSSAANRLWSAVYHRRFQYDWRMLSDVDRTHSFSWTVCVPIARLKQKYPILNRHAKSKFATIFNWTNKQKYPILNRHAKKNFATIFNWTNSVHGKNIH